MKTIKVITPDFGIQDLKPKKVFELFNHSFAVVDMPLKQSLKSEPYLCTHLIHFNSGRILPTWGKAHGQTLKYYVEKSKSEIEGMYKKFGNDDFNNQLNQLTILN